MTFLPIVDRELRVAARSRFTFWSRLLAATFALLIFAALQVLAQMSGGAVAAGQLEFTILKWMAFIYACAMGLFLTSDSLSEEKREGTLGLLFLTDLRGYDVVFGKLLTQSLRAFYGLLAAFPIMGLALLAGGVTGGEFTRSILVICNTLLFSLSLGMLVSAVSRDSTKAMNGMFLLLLLILAGLPFVDFALAGFEGAKFNAIFTLASPVYLFTNTGGYRFNEFWTCLILQNALAWVFLAMASLRVPHSWQEKAATSSASRTSFFGRWRFGGPRARLALRQRLLSGNPVVWLTLRDRWLPRLVLGLTLTILLSRIWALAVNFNEIRASTVARQQALSSASNTSASGGTVVYSSTNSSSSSSSTVVVTTGWSSRSPASQALVQFTTALEWLLSFTLYLWVASQASRFFVDGVRNGALELLLVTPVTPPQIVRAQWTALWRTFAFPVLCVVLLQIASMVLTVLEMKNQPVYTPPVTTGGAAPAPYVPPDFTWFYISNAVAGVLTFLAGLSAMAWYGMWMGLRNHKTSVAVLKTVCFVFVLPWIALAFARIFIMMAMIPAGILGSATAMLVIPALIIAVLNLGKDAFFIWLAQLNLRVHFRDEITRDHSPRSRSTGPAPPPPPTPPAYLPPAANAI